MCRNGETDLGRTHLARSAAAGGLSVRVVALGGIAMGGDEALGDRAAEHRAGVGGQLPGQGGVEQHPVGGGEVLVALPARHRDPHQGQDREREGPVGDRLGATPQRGRSVGERLDVVAEGPPQLGPCVALEGLGVEGGVGQFREGDQVPRPRGAVGSIEVVGEQEGGERVEGLISCTTTPTPRPGRRTSGI